MGRQHIGSNINEDILSLSDNYYEVVMVVLSTCRIQIKAWFNLFILCIEVINKLSISRKVLK